MHFLITVLIAVTALASTGEFNDADLNQLIEQTAKGHLAVVVYGWSPHMPLSVQGLTEILDLGLRQGVRIVPVLDPIANQQLTDQILRRRHWPSSYARRMTSERMLARGFRVHYPSYIVISRGHLTTDILPGYKTPASLRSYLRKYL